MRSDERANGAVHSGMTARCAHVWWPELRPSSGRSPQGDRGEKLAIEAGAPTSPAHLPGNLSGVKISGAGNFPTLGEWLDWLLAHPERFWLTEDDAVLRWADDGGTVL